MGNQMNRQDETQRKPQQGQPQPGRAAATAGAANPRQDREKARGRAEPGETKQPNQDAGSTATRRALAADFMTKGTGPQGPVSCSWLLSQRRDCVELRAGA